MMRLSKLAAIVTLGVVAASCASVTSTSSTTVAGPAPTVESVASYKASAQAVTVSQMANNPSNYDGEVVTFNATIDNFLQDSSGDTTAMNVTDPNDVTSVVYVQLSDTADVSRMNKADLVTIWGEGQGSVTAKNAFGGTIHESAVTEMYLLDHTTGFTDAGS